MVVLRSGTVYVKSEPQDSSPNFLLRAKASVKVKLEPQETPTNSATLSPVELQVDRSPAPPTPGAEISRKSSLFCYCGDLVAEKVCKGLFRPENRGRLMHVCARRRSVPCQYLEWITDPVKQESTVVLPVGDKTPEKETTPATSNSTPPTSPLLPSPDEKYICNCRKPARQYFCQYGRPENVNKYYFKCAEEKCRYWVWIESEEDEEKRRNGGKRKRYNDDEEGRNCYCGRPALRLVSRNGMPHNDGRAFYKCAAGKCGLWMWADGSLPYSNKSQARFNRWMDGYLGLYDDDDDYDCPFD